MNAPGQPASRHTRRCVDGVLLIDKPAGLTSNAVLGVVKRMFNAAKAGHTGTLDPFATGLLPVALGEATKFSGHLLAADKTYLATMRLGVTTATADPEGEVVEVREVHVTRAQLEAVLPAFTGVIDQVPPMYSALKRDGKPLYEYARAGLDVERASRRAIIHALSLVEASGDAVTFRVTCGKGTYVRTLAEDIGRALGCGAHLSALRRERTGGFGLEAAVTLDALEALTYAQRIDLLQPIDALVRDLTPLHCDAAVAARLRVGQRVAIHEFGVQLGGRYRAYDAHGTLIGMVDAAAGVVSPVRLVALAR